MKARLSLQLAEPMGGRPAECNGRTQRLKELAAWVRRVLRVLEEEAPRPRPETVH